MWLLLRSEGECARASSFPVVVATSGFVLVDTPSLIPPGPKDTQQARTPLSLCLFFSFNHNDIFPLRPHSVELQVRSILEYLREEIQPWACGEGGLALDWALSSSFSPSPPPSSPLLSSLTPPYSWCPCSASPSHPVSCHSRGG